jgi:hypothetical protein
MLFSLYSHLLIIVCFTVRLDLHNNILTGMIPSQMTLLTKLSEFSVLWLLIVRIVVMCFIIL